ncbi:MAG: hypothetical protein CML17_08015 [Pusillimonas sp.]|nr:hypothetical protein [Pusillimonas sp.]
MTDTSIFFFTAEDPSEIPRGSRDPLRFLPDWTAVGRRMIPCLTTVTPSYRGFLTRFLFHGALEHIAPQLAHEKNDEQWKAFSKFEQLCGLVRANSQTQTPGFPGITGAIDQKRLRNGRVYVGEKSDYWLMQSQRTTGFWGYYHQACRRSHLLKMNNAPQPGYLLSDSALQVFDSSCAERLMTKTYRTQLESLFKNKEIDFELTEFEDLARYFAYQPESNADVYRKFWHDHLLIGPASSHTTHNLELPKAFAQEVKRIVDQHPNIHTNQIWEKLSSKAELSIVQPHAKSVLATEAVIGLCEWLFDACRIRRLDGSFLSHTLNWAFDNGYNENWKNSFNSLESPSDSTLSGYRELILKGENGLETLARQLVDRHVTVMKSRKVAPWVELVDDRLHIRNPVNPPAPLDSNANTGVLWRNDYFLGSWLSVAKELGYIRGNDDA